MKIAILSFYYNPDLCAGSFRCTAIVDSLQKKLSEQDTVHVITTMPNRYATYEVTAPAHEEIDNVIIDRISLPSHKSGMLDQAFAFFHYYRAAMKILKRQKYDVVFATSSRLFTAFLGARVARQYPTKLYLDIRDIFMDTMDNLLTSGLKRKAILPFLNIVENYTFKRVDKVNLVSEGFLGYFKARYPHLKYDIFTNGIDEVFLNKAPQHSVDKSDKTTKYIVYAGNIGEGQGLHNIVPGMAILLEKHNYVFRIIGDGGRKQQLVNALQKADVKNVELIDPVNRDALIEHYAQADILFLHLNAYNAFEKVLPSKLFEYACFGKPILAGVSGYAARFASENLPKEARVFAPCDVDGGVEAVHQLPKRVEPNDVFMNKFSRTEIMNVMTDSVLNLMDKNQ